MRILLIPATIVLLLSSCWTKPRVNSFNPVYQRVWGSKPIYSAINEAKTIQYIDSALPVLYPGNIYAKGLFIYQLEIGKGIHVIYNAVPAQAHRIGFITVNGSSQISIKDNNLYTNSYDDLVVIDISSLNTLNIVSRLDGAFPEGAQNYFYAEPVESGYYECPRYDSVVIGWQKDSIWTSCFKN